MQLLKKIDFLSRWNTQTNLETGEDNFLTIEMSVL